MRHDLIRSIAAFGAPLLVGASLLYRIINGRWGSVAFMAIMFAAVFVFYLRFVPLDERDDEVSGSNAENPEVNGGSPSSNHPTTQPGR